MKMKIVSMVAAAMLLVFIVSGCLIDGGTVGGTTNTTPPTSPTSTSTTTTLAQLEALTLEAPGPAALPVNGLEPTVTGIKFRQQLAAVGGVPPYTWSVGTGSLPPGLILEPEGVISGTPAEAGSYNAALILADSRGITALGGQVSYSVTTPPPAPTADGINPGGPSGITKPAFFISYPVISYGSAPSQWADLESRHYLAVKPFVHGGAIPLTFTAVGLPEGLTCDPQTGLIEGPLAALADGMFTMSVLVGDSSGREASGSPAVINIRINYEVPAVVAPQPASGTGTLSVSCGNGVAELTGYGEIGLGGGIVTLREGSYILTVRSPTTGSVVWLTNVRIDAGKTTTVKWSGSTS